VPSCAQLLIVVAALLACACSSDGGAPPGSGGGGGGGGEPSLSGSVELGVPGGADSLDFAPLEEGAVLPLETFGQGGTHVLLGVRCMGFGQRAFVALRVRNLVDGTELEAPAPARPQLLFCEGEVCDLVPITVMTAVSSLFAGRSLSNGASNCANPELLLRSQTMRASACATAQWLPRPPA